MSDARLDSPRLERLIAVGRGLLAELNLDVVLDRLLETARELTGARYAALGILDDRRRELAQFITRGIDDEGRRAIGDLPRGRGILGLLIEDPRPLRIADIGSHGRSYGFPAAHPPMRGFLGVPIVIRGEVWGNLYLTEKANGEFDQDDEDTAVILADWAAIAIENARLYRTVDARRVELERAIRGFEATATIARAVGGETDLNRILELIVKRGRALVEAREVLILLRDGDDLVAAVADADETGDPRRLAIGASLAGSVLRSGVARRLRDTDLNGVVPEDALGMHGAMGALLVPMVYRGSALGVLVAVDRLAGDASFSAEDEEVLEAFAASAATAVATAKTVEAERLRRSIQAAEGERRRWARELHDETLQGLGALKVLLSGAARLQDIEAIRATINDAIEHVGGDITNLRAMITELRPAALDQLGLGPALTSLTQRVTSVDGLEVRAELAIGDADERLPSEVETTVYRLVQEALSNVLKHAGAQSATVIVRREGATIAVRIADDGVGFDPGVPNAGFGLMGMRERVELAGGDLRVGTRDAGGGGTTIEATLPIPGA